MLPMAANMYKKKKKKEKPQPYQTTTSLWRNVQTFVGTTLQKYCLLWPVISKKSGCLFLTLFSSLLPAAHKSK